MDIFKEASKVKLRFKTSVGTISVENLWDLKLEKLDELAVSLEELVDKTSKKSYLTVDTKETKESKLNKLRFDIVLDILKTKVANQEKASKAAETRAHNAKIDALIAKKKEEQFENMSIEDLEKLRK